jgi:hypothetical protein
MSVSVSNPQRTRMKDANLGKVRRCGRGGAPPPRSFVHGFLVSPLGGVVQFVESAVAGRSAVPAWRVAVCDDRPWSTVERDRRDRVVRRVRLLLDER